MKKIKTILIGTSEFAERVFTNLYQRLVRDIAAVAVVTTPDKPVGRKQELLPSPVKKWAEENKLLVFDFEHIKDPQSINKIKELNPDLIILCAYAQIIPKEILDIPKYGALNIHPSLLPKYRGASPIHAAILNGDKETGVTIMLMDEKMDHGPTISNFQFPISNKITYKELSDKLVNAAADLLVKTLFNWIEGKRKPKPQDHSKASFCKIIKKQDGKIDWNKSVQEIERQIRAFYQWPSAYTFYNDKLLKILEGEIINKNTDRKIGEVFLDENKNLCVQTGNDALILKQIQLEGKKPMPAQDFLRGHSEIIGSILK